MEVPKHVINELKDPNRKRSVKTIVHENWRLVEDIDKRLKTVENPQKESSILVVFMLQNFMSMVTLMVNPARRRKSIGAQGTKSKEVQEFEDDLRNAQKNWKNLFEKYERSIGEFVNIAQAQGKVDFHRNLWQKSRFQKIVNSVANFSEKVQNCTICFIPPSRYLFSLVTFVANWTLVPVFNIPKKLTFGTSSHGQGKYVNGTAKKNSHQKPIRTLRKLDQLNNNDNDKEEDEFSNKFMKFHVDLEEMERKLVQKESEWQEKSNIYQKEISARLEVQQKRLSADIDLFEEEKEIRRRLEVEEFQRRMCSQDMDFQKIISKIEEERKTFSDEEAKNLFAICQKQDDALLEMLDVKRKSHSAHWEEHEEFWANRLQIIRSALFMVRSEFLNFEGYLRQYLETPDGVPNFVKTVFKMESAAFGRTVTRAQALISNEHDFFDNLFGRYHDDLFLRVIWKITDNISTQLENVILELWSVAVNEDNFEPSRLRKSVMEIDPYSIPTTWRLKGMCNSADPTDYEDVLSIGSHSVYGQF